MSEKKNSSVGIAFLLILIIGLIITVMVLSIVLIQMKNEKNEKVQEPESIEQVSNLPPPIPSEPVVSDEVEEEKNIETELEKNERKKYDVNSESEVVIGIHNYLQKIWVMGEMYKPCIAEFETIKEAPIEYLECCIASEFNKRYVNKVSLNEINDMLIELFGKEADGLLDEADLIHYFVKNADGTYGVLGSGVSETWGNHYYVRDIEEINNMYYVSQYEFSHLLDEEVFDIMNGGGFTEKEVDGWILNKDEESVMEFILDWKDGVYYTKDKSRIGSWKDLQDFVISNYADKLSVRNIVLEGNVEEGFIMIKNELSK